MKKGLVSECEQQMSGQKKKEVDPTGFESASLNFNKAYKKMQQ